MSKHYDIVIVGGGLVGSCLALALRHSNYRVALLEHDQPKALTPPSPLDDRALVLSKASQNILSALGLWEQISSYATIIRHIHVSDKGRFGSVRLAAKDYDVDGLGWVALAQNLYKVLQAALSDIDVIYGAKFRAMREHGDCAVVEYEQNTLLEITAKLVVASDGSYSAVRTQQKITTTVHDYHQSVIICNVALQQDHQYCAYERFTQSGPCALLPMADKTCAVVWATDPVSAEQLIKLPTEEFIAQLQQHFGYRLGKFVQVSKAFAFPLSFLRADRVINPRLVIIGNSAQTLHPIAGQGLNLGLRDMATLADLLLDTHGDPGSDQLLQDYVNWRQFDQRHIIGLTHSLVTVFSNDFYPLALGRSLGMMVMERAPKLRELFAQSSMGMVGRLPKLVCGINQYV